MPILKSADVFHSSTPLAASASSTGPDIDLRTKYGTAIVAVITNGAAGPTTPPTFAVEVSNDGFVTFDEVFKAVAKTGNNAVTPFLYRVAPEILHARVKFVAGATNGSTVVARGHTVDTLG